MKFKLKKIWVLSKLKFVLLMKNFQAIIGSGMAIIVVITLKCLMEDSQAGAEINIPAFVLNFGLTFNSIMSAIMITSLPITEDKEKNTLRSLVSSTYSSTEYIISSILPAFIIIFLVNQLIIPLSGVNFTFTSWLLYTVLASIMALTSLAIGSAVGIISNKVQVTSMITVPIMLPLVIIPSLKMVSPVVKKVSHFLYSGIISDKVDRLVNNYSISFSLLDWTVVLGQLFLCFGIFYVVFRKKGIEITK